LIGVSATFRGAAGIKKIDTIMDAQFLKTSTEIKDRELCLEVFGAARLAKEKAQHIPVILFCSDPQ